MPVYLTYFSVLVLLLPGLNRPLLAQNFKGSMHDFQAMGNKLFESDKPCLVCHPPHRSSSAEETLPIWSSKAVKDTFTVYGSAGPAEQPGLPLGSSKLCLSCHDGTLALDSWGGRVNTVPFLNAGFEDRKNGLKNDHPISVKYTSTNAMRTGELNDPFISNSGLGNTIETDMLTNGTLQCSSCHDVHNGMGAGKLLVKTNKNSNLCLTCHKK